MVESSLESCQFARKRVIIQSFDDMVTRRDKLRKGKDNMSLLIIFITWTPSLLLYYITILTIDDP